LRVEATLLNFIRKRENWNLGSGGNMRFVDAVRLGRILSWRGKVMMSGEVACQGDKS
jgi:hypothetical protein